MATYGRIWGGTTSIQISSPRLSKSWGWDFFIAVSCNTIQTTDVYDETNIIFILTLKGFEHLWRQN
ncbi:hypothetical protein GCM10023310_65840 [Paenibacillus vulneris]